MVNYIGVGHICINTMAQQNQLTEEEKKQKIYTEFIENLGEKVDKFPFYVYEYGGGKYELGLYKNEPDGFFDNYKFKTDEVFFSVKVENVQNKTELMKKINNLKQYAETVNINIRDGDRFDVGIHDGKDDFTNFAATMEGDLKKYQ